MKALLLLLSTSLLMISPWALAHKKTQSKPVVISALPVLHALNQSLLESTPVAVKYLPAKRLPVSRISNWLKHKSQPAIAKLEPVTALITVESVWPEYALLKHMRSNNIAVIEIDAATEILAGGAQIRLSEADLKGQTAFWMAPDNLIVMSQIIARDMQRVWPRYAAQIKENQQSLQQAIRGYALKLDQILLEHDIADICLESDRLMPLARATYLPVETSNCATESLKIIAFSKKQPMHKGQWQVDSLNKPIKGNLHDWLSVNLQRLEQVL